MRKLCVLLVGIAFVLGVALTPATAAMPTSFAPFKGKQQAIHLVNDKHSLAPMKSIVNKLGGKVSFDKKTKQVTMTFGKTEVVMQAGKSKCYVNGKLHTLPIAPEQKGNNGTVFVPVRWLTELLGTKVDFLPGKPVEPPLVKPVPVSYQVLPQASLRASLLQTDPDRPLLWYGPASSLLEKPSSALRDKNILVVARGWQGSTGYGIEVQSLHVSDGELVVRVRLVNPKLDSDQATVMQYVYQVLDLPDELPQVDSWRIETRDGTLLNAQQLTTDVPYQVADGEDVSWADLKIPGVVAKPVSVKGQDKLLVVFKRGAVPTTGYGIELQSISSYAWGSLTAQVRHIDPAPGSFRAQVIRYPYQAVYLDPIYIGHKLDVALLNQVWDQLVTVPGTLKPAVDRSRKGILVGYGRDLLQNPGVWSDKLLLVAMRGYCPTGGYGVTVDSLLRSRDNLVLVKVSEQDPASDSMVTMAITYPYHIVQVPAELVGYNFQLWEKE